MATSMLLRNKVLPLRAATTNRVAVRPLCVARPQQQRVAPTTQKPDNLWLSAMVAAPFLLDVMPALAKDGEFGILEGRTAALIHPAVEFFILGASLYAAYLGWQWRRTRELGDEIRALKAASAPAPADGPAPVNPVIEQKEQERKALLAGGFRDKHFVWGSIILGSGVVIAIEGCVNTYMRTGRLFPGPHLYAGAIIVGLWAVAAALVPAMQKGDNNARNLHIALNVTQILMLISQVPTGLEIVGKVFEFTSWP